MKSFRSELGFTLAELAVVLVIVGLLLGGLMAPLSTQYEISRRTESEKALADIRDALIGYAIVNGRLPCPADRSIASGAANAGAEATTGTGASLTCECTAASASSTNGIAVASGGSACSSAATAGVTGVVPWATLGLPESDVWGNRYTYRVNATFARGVNSAPTTSSSFGTGCSLTVVSDMPTKAAFALCTQGDINVYTDSTLATTVASGIPAIVVSHGKNALGAWTTSGSQASSTSAATSELKNEDDDEKFVSSVEIDDQLIWVSPNLLMNKMISASKLP